MNESYQVAPEQHMVPLTVYYRVFLALMVMLVLTVAVAFVDLGRLSDAVALLIAGSKAALVVLYFMHVRYSSRLTWVFAGAGVVWLTILLLLTLSDYLTRIPVP